VTNELPHVTVIIPAPPAQQEVKAVAAVRRLDYPHEKLDIIVARGKQPSIQRNTAMKAAHGEILYFLDDDSLPEPSALKAAVVHFKDPSVKIVGGPNVCPPDAPLLEQIFAVVLGSHLAMSSSRARYIPVGAARQSSEKELILCNMAARRDAMLELGGFNEALYPNEENALMDELQKRGGKLIYDPAMVVHRRPRRTFKAFCKMMMTYGRGRAEQVREHFTMGSLPNFIPPVFCLYLIACLFLPFLLPPLLVFAPMALYVLALLAQWFLLVPHAGFFKSAAGLPLIFLTHVLYGIGFWRGLFTKLKPHGTRTDIPVTLETVPFPK
jgi:succinoglycan biosynthesis protein ExoA